MSTGYGWEGLPERLCGSLVYLERYNKYSPLPFFRQSKISTDKENN